MWLYAGTECHVSTRGIFTLRKRYFQRYIACQDNCSDNQYLSSELKFFYQEGASHLFPEAWEGFIAPIPEAERGDMMLAYPAQLNSEDAEVRLRAARAWSKWE